MFFAFVTPYMRSIRVCLVVVTTVLLAGFCNIETAFGTPSLSAVEKEELYQQGTDYFHQAAATGKTDPAAAKELYEKALLRFERLVKEGQVRNGKLLYNIGNIYFLLDDIGRAILNYRRAMLYRPNDPNLVKNLAYARSMRRDRLGMQEKEKILQTLFFFHYDIGTRTRLILFGLTYMSFWFFLTLKIFSRRPFTSWGLGVALFFAMLSAGSLYAEGRRTAANPDGVIIVPEIIGRQGDAESYQPSFADPLHAGTEFTLLEERGAWWRIELPDGRDTWVPAKSGEPVGQ